MSFDAENFAQVVYSLELDQIGVLWPKTWFGKIILLRHYEPNEVAAGEGIVYDDDKRFKKFKKVCNL